MNNLVKIDKLGKITDRELLPLIGRDGVYQ
jgi:hypothetical protein